MPKLIAMKSSKLSKKPMAVSANGAASRLGLKRTTFITRMKKLGIDPNRVSERDGVGTDTPDSSADSTAVLP